MPGQRIFGPRAGIRCMRVIAVAAPLFLTGCWPGEEGADWSGEAITPVEQDTSDQIVRVRKVDRLFLGVPRRRIASAPLPPIAVPEPPESRSAGRESVGKADRAAPAQATKPPFRYSSELAHFHRALYDIETGVRQEPVTILHLGDSHIASDRLTGDVRNMFQARFGDAGRGLMMPGFPFTYYRARQVKFTKHGSWKVANSFKGAKGPFGITGVRLTTRQKGARLSLTSTSGPFEWAEVTFLAGPGRGSATVAVDNKGEVVKTSLSRSRIKRVRIDHKGTVLNIRAKGDGPVTVLSWAVGHNRSGIRYVNLGIPGATADTARRWDAGFVDADITNLKPDLIILGFGTNEGFNDGLKIAEYEVRVAGLAKRLMASAPNASLAVIGPPDGARFPRYAKGKKGAGCRALNDAERRSYRALYRKASSRLARWHAPPKLTEVHNALERVAMAQKAHFWSWSEAMGGACAVHDWSRARPRLAASDHVHITAKGSLRSAHAFYASLMASYGANRKLASRSSAPTSGRQVR